MEKEILPKLGELRVRAAKYNQCANAAAIVKEAVAKSLLYL